MRGGREEKKVQLDLSSEQGQGPSEKRRRQPSVLPSRLPGSQHQAPEEERGDDFVTRFNLKPCCSSQSGLISAALVCTCCKTFNVNCKYR